MLIAETCLLLAVRDHLRTELTLVDQQSDLVYSPDVLPALAADKYFAVGAAGISEGSSAGNGTGWDFYLDVAVTVFHRMSEVSRDRRRVVYADRLSGLNVDCTKVLNALLYNQTLRVAAEAQLVGTLAAGGKFVTAFLAFTCDPTPKPVFSDPYAAATGMGQPDGDPILALSRTVTMRRMRFMRGFG